MKNPDHRAKRFEALAQFDPGFYGGGVSLISYQFLFMAYLSSDNRSNCTDQKDSKGCDGSFIHGTFST